MDSIEDETLRRELESLKADKANLGSLMTVMQTELEAALLMNDCYRQTILRLQEMNGVWMGRALKAESAGRRG